MRPNGMPLDPETAARLETAIQAEQAKIADLAEVLATYPVIQLGVAYRTPRSRPTTTTTWRA